MIYDIKKILKLCPTKKQISAMEDAVQFMSERKQRRFASFKQRVEYYWSIYPWMMLLVAAVVLMSCRSQQIIVPNDTTTNTDRYHGHYERDSIYLHDSIYVREYTQGDTVFLEKLVEHFKDRWLTRIDTITQNDTITITQTKTQTITEQVRYVPGFYKWCTGLFWVIVIGIIAIIILKICL